MQSSDIKCTAAIKTHMPVRLLCKNGFDKKSNKYVNNFLLMCYFSVQNATGAQLEEQFRCCICLYIYTDPVSITCGHNFCLDCIEDYWDTKDKPECPLCKEVFPSRPELRINHGFADIIEFLRFVLNII